jgi:hypothetical protein
MQIPDLILDDIEFWTEETLDRIDREQTAAAAKSAARAQKGDSAQNY